MYKQPTYGHALTQLDSADMFKQAPQGKYANTLVFTPPIDRQVITVRAIKALRLNADQAPDVQLSLNQYFPHG